MKKRIIRFAVALSMMMTALPVMTEAGCISGGITVYAAEKLSAPENFKAAETTKTSVKLTWSKVKGADAYRVYMYNSESDEYETYKTVTGTSCEVKFLTAGHKYKFKVAALKKNGEKYSVQTKSSPLIVKTKSSTTSSSSPKPSQKPGEFKFPNLGDSSKKVLKECGIGNYKKIDDSTQVYLKYRGKVYFDGIYSDLTLFFNEKDQLILYSLSIPMSYSDYLSYKNSLIDALGKNYDFVYDSIFETYEYIWKDSSAEIELEYVTKYGYDDAFMYLSVC